MSRRPNPLFEGRHHTSPSKIARAEECGLAYFLEHIRKLPTGERSVFMTSGSLGHAAIESVTTTRAPERLADPVTVAELTGRLEAIAHEHPFDPAALALARKGLEAAAPRIDLSLVAVDEYGPMVELGGIVDVGEGIFAGVKVDMVEDLGDAIVVRDYKTGFAFDSADEAAANVQVALYAAWAHDRFPGREIWVTLDYVVIGRQTTTAWDKSLDEFGRFTARTLVKRTRAFGKNERGWPARVGPHCARCPFTGRCAAYKAKLSEPVETREPETVEELVPEIRRMSTIAGLAEKRRKALSARARTMLADLVDRNGRAVIAGHPVKLTAVDVAASTEPRKGYSFLRVDVGDPIEVSPPEISGCDPAPQALASAVEEPKPTEGAFSSVVTRVATEPSRVDASGEAAGAEVGGVRVSARMEDPAPAEQRRSPVCGAPLDERMEDPREPSTCERPTGHKGDHSGPLCGPTCRHPSTPGAQAAGPGPQAAPAFPSPETAEGSPRATTPGEPAPSDDAPAPGPNPESGHQNPDGACAAPSGGGAAPLSGTRVDPTPTPAFGTVAPIAFTMEDGLSRIGRGQVRHVEDLLRLSDDESAGGLSSSILLLASRWHDEERVKVLWTRVGGELTKGTPPRRKPLTAGQLKRLLLELPAIHEEKPSVTSSAPEVTEALQSLGAAEGPGL